MLYDWNNKKNNYVEEVVNKLRKMRRDDVADLLQEEMNRKGDSCNCQDCGHIC